MRIMGVMTNEASDIEGSTWSIARRVMVLLERMKSPPASLSITDCDDGSRDVGVVSMVGLGVDCKTLL